MKRNTKIFCAALALVLVFGAVVGGTLAWLMDQTDPIENVFTVGNVSITLKESDKLDLKMVPGETITKDPKITVLGGSEDAWVFVELTADNEFDSYMSYTIADGWTALTDADADGVADDGVYYRAVDANADDQELVVIKDNAVYVSEDVTKAMMDNIANDLVEAPTLTLKGYAVQMSNIDTPADAWTVIQTGELPVETTVEP